MEGNNKIAENVSELLTNKRFKVGYSEVKKRLEEYRNSGFIDETQYNKISDEDFLLKIRYKTYKKCSRNIIIGLIFILVGLISSLPFRYLIVVAGLILSISSFFGILSNKLTKTEKGYIKR